MASIIKADTLQSTTANVFVLNSSGTEYARFDSSGVFQLANPTTFPAGTAALPSITATGDTNTGLYFPTADTIAFTEGGVESMRIDSSGNMGIGTASPTQKLTVAGSSSLGTASASGNLALYQAPGSLFLTMNTNGTLAGARRNWAISPEYDVAGALSFSVGTSEGAVPSSPRLIIKQQGAVILSGGSTSADGTGISFPATQSASSDANTLDDYEEGTFTMTYNAGTISSQNGLYTKIGRLVTAHFQIAWTAVGTSLGQIGGLPFNVSTTNYGGTHSREWYNTGASVQCVMSVGSATMDLFFYTGGRGVSNGSQYGVSGTVVYNI